SQQECGSGSWNRTTNEEPSEGDPMKTCAFAIAPRTSQSRSGIPCIGCMAPTACSAKCPIRLHVITVLLGLALACHAHAQTTAAASHADRLKVFKGDGI